MAKNFYIYVTFTSIHGPHTSLRCVRDILMMLRIYHAIGFSDLVFSMRRCFYHL